ncbi:MAG: hypothetical protein K1X48_10035 [Burkholderiaceae bacterium]|nr:hypothetical protein [Burkholderiaceae bacterium]
MLSSELVEYSNFFSKLTQDPSLLEQVHAHAKISLTPEIIESLWQQQNALKTDATACARALARLRKLVLGILILREVSAQASLMEVERAMTALAELALRVLLEPLEQQAFERFGVPKNESGDPLSLLVIGMGKIGAFELNVSSDIDVVYAIEEHGKTDRGVDALEVFEHIAERLTWHLSQPNQDGFVFRVDTRLRPFGDVGPKVLSLDALEHYFMAHARFWERCAWMKARILNASLNNPASKKLQQMIKAFVFKRYTDYTTIDGIKDLASKIAAERSKAREHARFGQSDVKLGRGGIREIEFIVQSLAITHGGRDPALQNPATRSLLSLLSQRQRLSAEIANRLDEAYVFLRRIEHAVQFEADRQTHSVPNEEIKRRQLASFLGFSSLVQFDLELENTRNFVAEQFEALLPSHTEKVFTTVTPRVTAWLAAARNSNEATQDKLRQVLLIFDQTIAEDEVFARAARFAQTIMRRRTYLDLILTYPIVRERLVQLMSASAFAADYLTRHPILLDELIDPEMDSMVNDWPQFDAGLASSLKASEDTEAKMNALRDAHHAQVLRILARDLAGHLTVEEVSDQLSLLADKILAAALQEARETLDQGDLTEGLAILAYGRLGAKELAYTSDLDLVFISDAQADREPERVTQLTRLVQRLLSWLSVQTTSGRLFEIDTRLRPNGNAGMLVTNQEAFARYFDTAALWEYQAITRARFCVGDLRLGNWFESLRHQLIAKPRQWEEVAVQVETMRRRVSDNHPNRSNLFCIKHDPGGLVDMEFAVQAIILAYASLYPDLIDNAGTLALATRAAGHGLIDQDITLSACDAYRHLRYLQHLRRMQGEAIARVSKEQIAVYATAVRTFVQAIGLNFPTRS